MEESSGAAQAPAVNGDGTGDGRPVPGIFVYTQARENGDLAVSFECMGGFDILSAPTLLEIAAKAVRHQLGLTD